MNRKYLRDIGLNEENWPETIYTKAGSDPDKRADKYHAYQEKYGVNPADTWNLDTTVLMWLYERLIEYKERAGKVVNLNYHIFEINGQEKAQTEWIDELILLAEAVLAEPSNLRKNSKAYKKLLKNEYVKSAMELDVDNATYHSERLNKEVKGSMSSDYFKEDCNDKFWKIWSVIYGAMWW